MTIDEQYVCNYALLRFLPYPETGEFVNVGVVAHSSAAGVLVSRIASSAEKRIAGFFPELDLRQFHWGRDLMIAEINRMQELHAERLRSAPPGDDRGRSLFLELVRPRESMFRFGEIRTLLTPEPQRVADQLFQRYVARFNPVNAADPVVRLAG